MKNKQATLELTDMLPVRGSFSFVHHEAFDIEKLPAVTVGAPPTEAFLETVRAVGAIIYPLVVVNTGRKLLVKDGLRRLAAARALKIGTVPVHEIVLNSVRGSTLGLILNNSRSENPIAELRMILELMKEGADEKLVNSATKMPISRIRRRLRLTSLHKELRAHVDRGRIKTNAAEQLAKMPVSEQKKALRHFRKAGSLSLADIGKLRRTESGSAFQELPDALFASDAHPAGVLCAWQVDFQRLLREAAALCPSSAEGILLRDAATSLAAKASAPNLAVA
jgi:ParB-like chromosome segregation protein Spo0J